MVNHKVYINEGLEALTLILKKEKAKRIFLVSGKKSFATVREVIEKLIGDRLVCVFDGFDGNPNVKNILDGIIAYKNFSPDLILSIGGGSAIDTAKSIRILAMQHQSIEKVITGKEAIRIRPSVPLIVMPTTAGTGSEATHFSVVYIDKKKYSLASQWMLPNYVILDPYLVRAMPKYVAACTAFDALSQAVESYWSKNSTIESKRYASRAIELLLHSMPASIDMTIPEKMEGMIKAAYFSGCAINITKTTAPHALSYSLTSYFGVPHGHAVALLLGPTAVISYEDGDENAKKVLSEIFDMFDCQSAIEFNDKWKELMRTCGLTVELSEFGVCESDIKTIIDGVNIERMKGHPVRLCKKSIRKILEYAVI